MNEINECFHKTERSASLSRPSKKTSIMFSFDQWLMISTIITIIIVLSSTTTTMAASLLLSSMPFGQIPISHPSLMRKMNSLINDRTSTFSSSKSSTPSFETNLAINLRNDGGEIFRETIIVNRLRDYIVIDFEETDSSQIRKIIDFHNVSFRKKSILKKEKTNLIRFRYELFIDFFSNVRNYEKKKKNEIMKKNISLLMISMISFWIMLKTKFFEIKLDSIMKFFFLSNFKNSPESFGERERERKS